MASQSNIFNLALVYLGANRVTVTGESSEPADVMNVLYPETKRMCLEKADWAFAHKVRNLGAPLAVGAEELEGMTAMHSLPQDFVKAWKMVSTDPRDALAFREVADRRILTNFASPDVVYTADVAEGAFSGHFTLMLAAHLAWQATYTLTSFAGRRLQLTELYLDAEGKALYDNELRNRTKTITADALRRVR